MNSLPIVQGLRVRAVRVPMKEPHQTASGVITESPLVLTDTLTDTGIRGHSLIFTYTPAALKPTADFIQNFETLARLPCYPRPLFHQEWKSVSLVRLFEYLRQRY